MHAIVRRHNDLSGSRATIANFAKLRMVTAYLQVWVVLCQGLTMRESVQAKSRTTFWSIFCCEQGCSVVNSWVLLCVAPECTKRFLRICCSLAIFQAADESQSQWNSAARTHFYPLCFAWRHRPSGSLDWHYVTIAEEISKQVTWEGLNRTSTKQIFWGGMLLTNRSGAAENRAEPWKHSVYAQTINQKKVSKGNNQSRSKIVSNTWFHLFVPILPSPPEA